jgi:GcrA cell cycle regulator
VSWSDERISTLKKMWQQGKSASEIADKLGGVTRNAVIGKAHRLGLSGRPSPIKPVAKKAAVAAPAKKPVAVATSSSSGKKAAAPAKEPPVAASKKGAAPAKAPAKTATPPAKLAQAKQSNSSQSMKTPPIEPLVLAALANATSRPDGKIHSILELNEKMCRWPVGDPKESGFGYCGALGVVGHPYCAEHIAIAFQAPSRKDGKKPKDIKMAEVPELEDLEIEVEDAPDSEDEALEADLDDDDSVVVKV